eukprot:CAMPEP_0178928256 /NCGR_PEP_ID=MMETSP0786-20121207/19774_1 /TAXON_ID=186022 /ORGANISM="Thalassionema frauenfeldii, Strain CCMP 1798" /LENGTH=52 /DNA_ID=CAMNT_0020604043 /DNA_START=15 /DNA_END=170 /DNA_ORIENTATION=+
MKEDHIREGAPSSTPQFSLPLQSSSSEDSEVEEGKNNNDQSLAAFSQNTRDA